MIICKVVLVLVVGCMVVIKFVEYMLFLVLVLVVLVEKVGFLFGVFNVIIVSEVVLIGKELIINFIVKKIFFIGLIWVGKILLEQVVG